MMMFLNLGICLCLIGTITCSVLDLDTIPIKKVDYENRNPAQEPTDVQMFTAMLTALRGLKKMTPQLKKSVCYGELECFYSKDSRHLMGILPDSPEKVDARFYLYRNQEFAHEAFDLSYRTTLEQLRRIRFDPSLPVKFIVHGFGSGHRTSWMQMIKQGYLTQGPCNVFLVDWSKGAQMPLYVKASANTKLVAREIGTFIMKLVRLGVDIKNIHLIGHSLGAQICGFVGKYLNEKRTSLGRITGLDPAGPLFCYDLTMNKQAHLESSDADFVDVIHTNAGVIVEGQMGCWDRMGDVDFYPNGGRWQPGCYRFFLDYGKVFTDIGKYGCFTNHARACELFAESILPATRGCNFTAFPCASNAAFNSGKCFGCNSRQCNSMGAYAEPIGRREVYYLKTGPEIPLCSNQMKVTAELAGGAKQFQGELVMRLSGDNLESRNIRMKLTPGPKALIIIAKDERKITQIVASKYHYNHLLTKCSNFEASLHLESGIFRTPSEILREKRLTLKSLEILDEPTGMRLVYCGRAVTINKAGEMTIPLKVGSC